MKKRRRIKLVERLTPCECCDWPISHRHHLIPFDPKVGEVGPIAYLCARCHEVYHLLSRVAKDLSLYGEGATTHNTVLLRAIKEYLREGEDLAAVNAVDRMLNGFYVDISQDPATGEFKVIAVHKGQILKNLPADVAERMIKELKARTE